MKNEVPINSSIGFQPMGEEKKLTKGVVREVEEFLFGSVFGVLWACHKAIQE